MIKKLALSIMVPVFTGCATLPPPSPVEDFESCTKINTTADDAKKFLDICMSTKLAAMLTVKDRNPETGRLAYIGAAFAKEYLTALSKKIDDPQTVPHQRDAAKAKRKLFLDILNLNGITEQDIKESSSKEVFSLSCKLDQFNNMICK